MARNPNNVTRNFVVPAELSGTADRLAGEMDLNFSQFMRRALQRYIDELELDGDDTK